MTPMFLLSVTFGVTMPRWFGDNMVLQTNAEYGARAFLSGKAKPNETITVVLSPSGRPAQTTRARSDGTFEVQVMPGTSRRLTVTVTGEDGPAAVAHNVSGGDVFFCSGQSNMVFPLSMAFNHSAEAATLASFPLFRFFMTGRDTAATPQFDLRPVGANGTACDADTNCNKWLTATEALAPSPSTGRAFIDMFSAVCFMTVRDIARMHADNEGQRPIALIQSAWGGTRVEAWMSTEALAAAAQRTAGHLTPPPRPNSPNAASVLYNAMVAPWNKFAVRAAFWYQGEANADQKLTPADKAAGGTMSDYYSQYLQEMVADWRERKGMGDFAFLTVQLPPSVGAGTPLAKQLGTGRMEIRIAEQTSAPHTGGRTDISGVAVTVDLGGKSGWGFDHPPNKNEIARRLALQTVHAAYAVQGRIPRAHGNGSADSLWSGPVLTGVGRGNGRGNGPDSGADSGDVVLSFANWSAVGLTLRDVKALNIDGSDNSCTLCCAKAAPFEVQLGGSLGNWSAVALADTAIDAAASTVTLKGTGGAFAVRYAWTDYVECTLVNDDRLPLSPFVQNVAGFTGTEAEAVAAAPSAAGAGAGAKQLTPPMGFNSWNFYHCNIDENTVKGVIDAIVSNGMKEAGYEFVNIDDCWQVERFPNGTIQPDPVRFPSGMKALADYAHSKGLKFGVYTARGSRTCQDRPGSFFISFVSSIILFAHYSFVCSLLFCLPRGVRPRARRRGDVLRVGARLPEERQLRRDELGGRKHVVDQLSERLRRVLRADGSRDL